MTQKIENQVADTKKKEEELKAAGKTYVESSLQSYIRLLSDTLKGEDVLKTKTDNKIVDNRKCPNCQCNLVKTLSADVRVFIPFLLQNKCPYCTLVRDAQSAAQKTIQKMEMDDSTVKAIVGPLQITSTQIISALAIFALVMLYFATRR